MSLTRVSSQSVRMLLAPLGVLGKEFEACGQRAQAPEADPRGAAKQKAQDGGTCGRPIPRVSEAMRSATIRDDFEAAAAELECAARHAQAEVARQLFGSPSSVARIGDRYRRLGRIGAGGQGAVWRAYDEQLAREVAIKTVHLTRASPQAQAWLRREARTLGRLTHPGVVAVYDLGLCPAAHFGEDGDRTVLYTVMELVDGETLADWLARATRSVDEVLGVMAQVADALAAVHRAGLVHCDVKPANILVAGARVKLADFGLAHATRALGEAVALRSEAGVDATTLESDVARTNASHPAGGTLRYVAPEQMLGERIDARADEFAFAVTLFEALFGHAPHGGQSPAAWLQAKRDGAPRQPSARLPRAAYRALARGLAGDPAQRHGGPRVALDAILRGRRSRRGPAMVAVAAVLGLGGLAGPRDATCPAPELAELGEPLQRELGAALRDAGMSFVAERVVDRMRHHDAALRDLHQLACDGGSLQASACVAEVDAQTRAIADVLAHGVGDRRRVLAVLSRLSDPLACVDGEYASEAPGIALDDARAWRAWAELVAARALDDAGDPAAALARIDALPPAEIDALAHELGITRGGLLREMGRYAEAGVAFDAVFRSAEAAGDDLAAARAAVGLAFVHGIHGADLEHGQRWVRSGYAHVARGELPATVVADLANAEGAMLFVAGRHVDARAVITDALAQARELPPVRTRALRENRASLAATMGDRAAIDEFARLLDETVETLGETHPTALRTRSNLATAQLRFGEHAAARTNFEQVLALRDGAFGSESVENARVLSQLADLDVAAGDVVGGLARLAAANELRARVLTVDHPERANGVLQLIEMLLDSGDLEGAQRMLAIHRDNIAAHFGLDEPIGQDLVELVARVAEARGDVRTAAAAYADVLAGLVAIGRDDADLAGLALASARTHLAAGPAAGDLAAAVAALALARRGRDRLGDDELVELAALERRAATIDSSGDPNARGS
ncbi:MAG: serine/threonine protein kinase [Deltaproteobacteria bacterium]|nr:serine/threonine protein kinase [Deltaproteobacteria bacterium]